MQAIAYSAALWWLAALAQAAPPAFPRVCTVPLPNQQIAFEVDGNEVARYHYAPTGASRPYVFPLVGPAGRGLTRMGHPHDPHGHRHHQGVWVAHKDVNGVDFWGEGLGARIVHDRIEKLTDGLDTGAIIVRNRWLTPDGRAVLEERRTLLLTMLDGDERYLDVRLELTPVEGAVTFGKTPFGFLGVRVAKTMSTHDGGGAIRNAEGAVNEEAVLWQRARWVDYSGPVTPHIHNGIAFFDHPANPRFPTYFHVRGDGWMGAALCFERPFVLEARQTLSLQYRLYAHGPDADTETIEAHWRRFAAEPD